MTATVKLWTRDLLLELLPVGQPPSVDFEVLDIMAKVGHMFCSERLVWGLVRKGGEMARDVHGRSRTETTSSTISIGGPPLTFSSGMSMVSSAWEGGMGGCVCV